MKKRMPKVLLVLALVCVLAIGAAVATFADTTGNATVTGDGQWYYSITSSATDTDAGELYFYVELCDENGNWFTTTSAGERWTWDGSGELSYDELWSEERDGAGVAPGDVVYVQITREGGDFTVAWYVNDEWYYSAHCENSNFTDTVTWQVNVQSGDVTVSELTEEEGQQWPYVADSNEVKGNGSWYYTITVDESENMDGVLYFVELFDENNDWFTTASDCNYWTWDDDGTLTCDNVWDTGGNWESVNPGDEVVVEITRQDGTIAVAWYINGEWSYTAVCEGASFMETVTWQVNIQSEGAVSCEFGEGHPVSAATTITNVEVKSLSQEEFIVGSEFDLAGTVLTITYENGDTAELTVGEDWGTYDAYDNYITVYGETEIVEEYNDGEEAWTATWTERVSQNNPIYCAGTYTVKVEVESYDPINNWTYTDYTTEATVAVREATTEDAASAVELVLDETYDVETEDQWFTYTPVESGYYVFKTVDGTTYDGNYVTLYVDYGDGTLNLWTNEWYDNSNGVLFRCYLEAGYTYYYRTINYYGNFSVYKVEITEGKTVASFIVDSLGKNEFTQYIGSLDLSGSVLTVTYTDGTTATVTVEKAYGTADEYGNYFYYCVTDYVWGSEDWDYEYWCSYNSELRLDPGTYTVTFYTHDAYDEDEGYVEYTDTTKSITVVALADTTETVVVEILDEEYPAEIVSGDIVWYSYTPAEDGNYYLIADWDGDENIYCNDCWPESMRTYDEDGNCIWPDNGYVDDDCWYYDEETGAGYEIFALEAGVTYYIPVYYNAYDENWHNVSDAVVTATLTMKQVGHVHSYANEEVIFDWAEDYSTATASLRCDTCSHIETTVNCTIDSVTTAATTEAEGSIVYTATAVINGKTYVSDPETVILEKLAKPETPAENPTETPTEDPTETPTEDPTETPTEDPTEAPTDGTATPTNATPSGQLSPAEGDVSVWAYVAILLGAAAAAVVLAKKKANA